MCGIFGEVVKNQKMVHIARRARNAGIAINYRGSESAGITMTDGIDLRTQKGFGEYREAVPLVWVELKKGMAAIAQNRYSTTGSGVTLLDRDKQQSLNPLLEFADLAETSPGLVNCQPFYLDSLKHRIKLSLVFNGNLTNILWLRKFLSEKGIETFLTDTDTELILQLIIHFLENPPKQKLGLHKITMAIKQTINLIRGAYSCLLLTNEGIWAFRDPKGIRPLKMAETPDSFLFASEPVAWYGRNINFLGNVTPGQIVQARIGSKKLLSYQAVKSLRRAFCVFEDIYLQASYNKRVAIIRKKFGTRLLQLYPKPGIVMPILTSGEMSAYGYHNAQGRLFPGKSYFWPGLYKNPHVGRTFLEPSKDDRIEKNKKKYFPLLEGISDEITYLNETEKEIWLILIDDSLVRSNTAKTLIFIIRQELQRLYPEVYDKIKIAWLLAAPPYTRPCYYGVDTYDPEDLIAARLEGNLTAIKESIAADYIGYLPIKDTLKIAAEVHGLKPTDFCAACFTGKYPVKIDPAQTKMCLNPS